MTLPTPTQEYEQGILDAANRACDLCGITPHSDMRIFAKQAAIVAILAERERDRWMPISDAKQMQLYDVYFTRADGPGQRFVDVMLCDGDWYSEGHQFNSEYWTPTHFMPLPDAPKGGDK